MPCCCIYSYGTIRRPLLLPCDQSSREESATDLLLQSALKQRVTGGGRDKGRCKTRLDILHTAVLSMMGAKAQVLDGEALVTSMKWKIFPGGSSPAINRADLEILL